MWQLLGRTEENQRVLKTAFYMAGFHIAHVPIYSSLPPSHSLIKTDRGFSTLLNAGSIKHHATRSCPH